MHFSIAIASAVSPRSIASEIAALPKPAIVARPIGAARIETYTVEHDRAGRPERGLIIGRLEDGSRFIANAADSDAETLARLADERTEPTGRRTRLAASWRSTMFRWSRPNSRPAPTKPLQRHASSVSRWC